MRERVHINIHIFLCVDVLKVMKWMNVFEKRSRHIPLFVIERKRALLRWGGGGVLAGGWFFQLPPFWWIVEPVEFLPTYVTYPPWAWWCSLMESRQGPGTRGRKNRHIQDTNRRGTGPPTEPGFSQGFFSILSPMEFSFLAAVASGLLSWGHLISSTIIDLIAQILFKLN